MTLAARLRSEDVGTRAAAIGALAEQGRAAPDELDALAACLADPRKAVQRPAAEAFAALAARGVRVAEVLDAASRSKQATQRWGAVYALSLVGAPPPHVLPVILDALGADDGDVRWAAAAILLRLADRATLVDRLRGLAQAGNAAQRKMALYCLRDLGARSAEVEEVILRAAGDGEVDVRLAAFAALARLARDREAAAERLLVVLATGTERERRAAAAALGTLGERHARVLAALRAASESGDDSLCRAARGALRRLGG